MSDRQAGVEVTEGMLSAGKEALASAIGGETENLTVDFESTVEAIYRAMLDAQRGAS